MARRTSKVSKPERIDMHVEWKLLYLPRPPNGNGRRPVSTRKRAKVPEVEKQITERKAVGQS